MARLIFLFLIVTLSALVSCAPQRFERSTSEPEPSSSPTSSSDVIHRLGRSPHHDGTDHDHEHDEKTDQDHEHPVLTSGDAKKVAVGGESSTKPRTTRDTSKDSKEKEGDHSADTTKDDAEDDEPKHLPIKNSTTLIGGGRVVRDTQQTEKPVNVVLGANAPGPFLLQGEPIHTHLLATHDSSSSSEEKSSEEHKKTKRESPTPPPGYQPKNNGNNGGYPPPPPTQKYGNPLVQPHLDPTPPPGYKPRYNRDTGADDTKLHLSDPNHPARASAPPVTQDLPDNTRKAERSRRETDQQQTKLGAPVNPPPPVHIKTEDGRDATIALPQIPSGPPKQHKRDTADPKLGGPLSPPAPVHIKTEDGRDATIALPPTPGGPQSPKHKRDTADPKLGGPLSSTSTIHTKTEDGRDASIALPQTPAGPQGPKQHKRDTSDPKLGGPLLSTSTIHTKTEDGRDASIALPPTPGGPQGPKQHKRDTDSELSTSTRFPPKFRGTIPPKDGHELVGDEKKQKRDTYSPDHKDENPVLPLHEHSESDSSKLSPPIHESEYDRHTRATDKDEPKKEEAHSSEQHKSTEEHDHSKSKSSEEKKDA